MSRRSNGDFSNQNLLLMGAGLVAAFFIMRKVRKGAATVGGYLSPEGTVKKDGVSYVSEGYVKSISFSPETILSKNPRFKTEPMADRSYAIKLFGGKVVDAAPYPYTLEGFQKFLDDSGVNRQWSSAFELAKVNKPDVGARFGYTLFLPPQVWWPKAAALALMQNRIREKVGAPVVINNWWRPAGYNEAVGGKTKGDHQDGDALDLNFRNPGEKWVGAKYVHDISQSEPSLAVSLGIYSSETVLHTGLQSSKGKRTWDYRKGEGTGARITSDVIARGLAQTGKSAA